MESEHLETLITDGQHMMRHLPDAHSSDTATSDEESDFETEPLETSSPSSHDSESSAEEMLNHRRRRYQNRCRTPSSSEESDMSKELPDWFQDKAFLYNGRISILAMPGMLLVLLFSGDLLLFTVTVGSLVTYLFYNAGSKQKALLSYVATFIVIQLTVVYSVLPLLWKSILNIVVIVALNVYTFMTGGWILLLFEDMRFHDVDLLTLIEAGLFSIYPVVFVVLITWSAAAMTTVAIAPCVLMLVGFIVLQVFLSPTTSSFVKPHPQGSLAVWDLPTGYILDPSAVAAIAMLYAITSPSLLIVVKLLSDWKSLFTITSLVQILFVAACSIFLATFLNLRLFLEAHGLQQRHLLILRWSASFVAIGLVVPLLTFFEIQSNLLPWIPLILAVYVSIIVCHLQRSKAAVRGSLAILALGFFLMFCQLPWTLEYYVARESTSITWLQILLALNASLCVAAIYGAIYWTNDALGLCLLALSICYVYAARLLLLSELISFLSLLILASMFSYLSIRLYHSNKMSWQHSLLISSVHLTALATNVDCFHAEPKFFGCHDHYSFLTSCLVNAYEFLSSMFFFVIILHLLVFEQRTSIRQAEVCQVLGFLVGALLVNIPCLLTNFLYIALGNQPVFAAYLGLGSLIVSCVYLKLAFFNSSLPSKARYYIVILIVLPLLTLLLQPQLSIKSEELQKWSAIIGLSCIFVSIPLASAFRNSLHVVGSCLGLPLAFCCLHLLFPSHPSLLIRLTLGVKVMLSVILLLVAWQNPRHSNKWIKSLGLMIGVTSGVLLILESTIVEDTIVVENPDVMLLPSTISIMSAIVAFLLVAAVIKVRNSEYEQNQLDGRMEHDHHVLSLAVLGNIYTVGSLVLFLIQWRASQYWYFWVCVFSPSLLLLNKDNLLLASLTTANRFAPVAIAISLTLTLATVLDCAFFMEATIFQRVIGFFELITLTLTVPVVLNFWTVCWCGRYWWSDKLVVFLTPVYFLFFFLGRSYVSWTLASLGLGVGAWLMKYKLPLEIER